MPTASRSTAYRSAKAEVFVDREMAINPGKGVRRAQRARRRDPAFGLDAVWIDAASATRPRPWVTRCRCEHRRRHPSGRVAAEPCTRTARHDEVQQLLDNLAPDRAQAGRGPGAQAAAAGGRAARALQNLLQENVPIRDMRTIAETLAEQATKTQDAASLTAAVRVALARSIVQQVVGPSGEIPVIVLDPALERLPQQTLVNAGDDGAGIEPGMLEQLQTALQERPASRN